MNTPRRLDTAWRTTTPPISSNTARNPLWLQPAAAHVDQLLTSHSHVIPTCIGPTTEAPWTARQACIRSPCCTRKRCSHQNCSCKSRSLRDLRPRPQYQHSPRRQPRWSRKLTRAPAETQTRRDTLEAPTSDELCSQTQPAALQHLAPRTHTRLARAQAPLPSAATSGGMIAAKYTTLPSPARSIPQRTAVPIAQHAPARSVLTAAPVAPPSPPAGSCSHSRSRPGSRSL